jgi:hypothetical protein
MQPPKSIFSAMGMIGIIAAIVIALILITSGWEITDIDLGFVTLKKPTNTVGSLQSSPATAVNSPPDSSSPLHQNDHVPVIIKVEDEEEYKAGRQFLYKDILFIDPAGDADRVVYELVWAGITGVKVYDDPIRSSPAVQKKGAYVRATWDCKNIGPYTVILKARIVDEDTNRSSPETIIFNCR